ADTTTPPGVLNTPSRCSTSPPPYTLCRSPTQLSLHTLKTPSPNIPPRDTQTAQLRRHPHQPDCVYDRVTLRNPARTQDCHQKLD
ncbi:hypothetical protein ACQWKP_23315, partial [Salmonella enterica subsp. enterica serovar Infantis]